MDALDEVRKIESIDNEPYVLGIHAPSGKRPQYPQPCGISST